MKISFGLGDIGGCCVDHGLKCLGKGPNYNILKLSLDSTSRYLLQIMKYDCHELTRSNRDLNQGHETELSEIEKSSRYGVW